MVGTIPRTRSCVRANNRYSDQDQFPTALRRKNNPGIDDTISSPYSTMVIFLPISRVPPSGINVTGPLTLVSPPYGLLVSFLTIWH